MPPAPPHRRRQYAAEVGRGDAARRISGYAVILPPPKFVNLAGRAGRKTGGATRPRRLRRAEDRLPAAPRCSPGDLRQRQPARPSARLCLSAPGGTRRGPDRRRHRCAVQGPVIVISCGTATAFSVLDQRGRLLRRRDHARAGSATRRPCRARQRSCPSPRYVPAHARSAVRPGTPSGPACSSTSKAACARSCSDCGRNSAPRLASSSPAARRSISKACAGSGAWSSGLYSSSRGCAS